MSLKIKQRRAGFGTMAENANELKDISQKYLYKLLVKTSAKKPENITLSSCNMSDESEDLPGGHTYYNEGSCEQ